MMKGRNASFRYSFLAFDAHILTLRKSVSIPIRQRVRAIDAPLVPPANIAALARYLRAARSRR
jgi:hypothetical protein